MKNKKKIKKLEFWTVQKTHGGHFRFLTPQQMTSNIVDSQGVQCTEIRQYKEGDFVETVNTIYHLGKCLFTHK